MSISVSMARLMSVSFMPLETFSSSRFLNWKHLVCLTNQTCGTSLEIYERENLPDCPEMSMRESWGAGSPKAALYCGSTRLVASLKLQRTG